MTDLLLKLHMGGYGAYVWPAYGLVTGLFIGLVVHANRAKKRVIGRIQTQGSHES